MFMKVVKGNDIMSFILLKINVGMLLGPVLLAKSTILSCTSLIIVGEK